MRLLFVFLFCSILNFSFLFAQRAEYGAVSPEDLSMSVYPKDSTANAVVLSDFGTMEVRNIDGRFQYYLKRHTRIKILNKQAFNKGDIAIPYYNKVESVYNIKGQTFNVDGSITELRKKDVFDEENNEYWSMKKFSMPNIQKGAIIEYEYEFRSDHIVSPNEWFFQGEYPVRHSEIIVGIDKKLEYVFLFQGNTLEEGATETDGLVEIKDGQFIMRNAPALQEEAYITSMDNYRARVRFQLNKVYWTSQDPENYLSSWEEVGKELYHEFKFGQQYRFKRNFNKAWKAIAPLVEQAQSDTEKIQLIYDYVQKTIAWNGYYGIYADGTLDKIVNEGKGDIASINILLVGLLKQAGINAKPMLCGVRKNGFPVEKYSIIEQFNYVLAYIETAEKPLLLDASSSYFPLGYIRREALNYKGWVVDKNYCFWTPIKPKSSSEVIYVKQELQDDGLINGVFKGRYNGYAGIYERYAYAQAGKDYWKEQFETSMPDLKVDSISFENETELNNPFSNNVHFSWQGGVQEIGDFLYISPILYSNFDENPFKLEERNYPVEMPYPFKEQLVVNLVLPEGYAVEALPDNINLIFPNKEAQFRYLADAKHGMITITSKIEINRTVFDSEDYTALKNFFDSIVETYNEQIVLKKIAE